MTAATRAKILVVDDQPNNLLAAEAMLVDLGQEVIKARSGFEALRRLLEDDYAVILLDVMMPEMDGYETAQLIRERERSRSTPIIFLTAFNQNEANVFRGYSLGAVDFLFKPIVPEVLRSKVQFFVELFQKNEAFRRQTSELARLSRQMELILSSAADGIFGLDLDGNVTFVNPSAARLLSRRIEKITGRNVHDLVHPAMDGQRTCNPERCRLSNALRGRTLGELLEETFYRYDGSAIPIEYSITAMQGPEGEVFGSVLTFRDVTERRAAAMAQENERLYQEARAQSQAKDDFLATLSHELRTPMTAIMGWVELLGMGDLDDAVRKEAIEAIRASARHQSQLIEDMLDVSRIVLGKFRLELQPSWIQDVMREVVDTVQPNAANKGIELQTDIWCEGIQVMADLVRLKQAIWNLVSNSIKFTDTGGRVKVSTVCEADSIRITVEDNGIGIEPEVLPNIFNRLEQGEAGKRHGGLGLGLAIVHYIVLAHGGKIEAFSDGIGKGAKFTITLPIWKEGAQEPTAKQIPAAQEENAVTPNQ